ncbi:D-cysteine desulfhydrase family protein [Pseudalkalibacillus sp. A8]|uniref:D-cysteine desulfhydrase family protein n=1 Tax=Pseudalkalibacillus sp. A8 TaxID=3382641 RepID=UPI0038B68CD0
MKELQIEKNEVLNVTIDWKEIPRVKLANLPTKLEEMNKLTEKLNGPQLYIKRDDETGLAFGGNKVRKLEFILADAIQQGAEIIITSGGAQTNHGRLTAAAAVKLGLKPVIVLTDMEPDEYKGNLLLDYLLGTELHFVYGDPNLPKVERAMQSRLKGNEKVEEIREYYEKKGKKCYVVPRGGRSIQGTLGYLLATLEIYEQVINQQLNIDYIVTPTGSTSTLGSLLIGSKLFNTGIKPIGISVSRGAEEIKDLVMEQIELVVNHFNLNISIDREEIVVFDDYIGPGYAIPSESGIEAIKLLSSTESIFVDQNYTGKAMAGLIDLVRKKYFTENHSVLFLHTGGNPALFSIEDQLLRINSESAINSI